MSSPLPSGDGVAERAALIHRETIQLAFLICLAVAAFFVTKVVASNNRDLSLRNAAEWYRRGERFVANGRTDDAIEAFRRATVRSRTNRTYILALARALTLKHDYDSARNLLLTLRESAPENAEINLDLARLAATRQDVTETLRFYRDALYAPWPVDQTEKRRAVRLELIRFLLTHDQSSRAQSELLAASADMPEDATHHIELAALFAQAGDDRNALAHFQRALRLAPDDGRASAGAGTAAFRLGQYSVARRYLDEAGTESDGVRTIRNIVDLVLSRDPIAARLGAPERRQRLTADLAYVRQRLTACLAAHSSQPAPVDELTLQDEVTVFERRLRRVATLDQDIVESGVGLIERIERDVLQRCGPATDLDQALLLIARQHGVDSR